MKQKNNNNSKKQTKQQINYAHKSQVHKFQAPPHSVQLSYHMPSQKNKNVWPIYVNCFTVCKPCSLVAMMWCVSGASQFWNCIIFSCQHVINRAKVTIANLSTKQKKALMKLHVIHGDPNTAKQLSLSQPTQTAPSKWTQLPWEAS